MRFIKVRDSDTIETMCEKVSKYLGTISLDKKNEWDKRTNGMCRTIVIKMAREYNVEFCYISGEW